MDSQADRLTLAEADSGDLCGVTAWDAFAGQGGSVESAAEPLGTMAASPVASKHGGDSAQPQSNSIDWVRRAANAARRTLIFITMEGILQVTIDGIIYVSHEDPAWRGDNNFMAMVDLTPFDLGGMIEQVWLRKDEEGCGYEVCCIPFYAYGLALGDVVEKTDSNTAGDLVSKSGHRVLRVFFAEPRPSTDSRSALSTAVESAGLLSEWNGDRHVAIDVTDISAVQSVFDSIHGEIQNRTAFREWNDSKNFRST
ncbi:DUF4265 domain-containing protein [Streptomyces sp. YIM S03343]